jgi:ribosomal protein S25
VRAYSAFFEALCERTDAPAFTILPSTGTHDRHSTRARDDFVPVDRVISEVVLVKDTRYLTLRAQARYTHPALPVTYPCPCPCRTLRPSPATIERFRASPVRTGSLGWSTCSMCGAWQLKAAFAQMEGDAAREHFFHVTDGTDANYAAKLKQAKEQSIALQEKLTAQIRAEVTKPRDVTVSAVFVSFNTAAARDKVLHELRPKTVLGFTTEKLRNAWPCVTPCHHATTRTAPSASTRASTVRVLARLTGSAG